MQSTIGGWFVPRGTEIYIPNLVVNTDKSVWGACSAAAALGDC